MSSATHNKASTVKNTNLHHSNGLDIEMPSRNLFLMKLNLMVSILFLALPGCSVNTVSNQVPGFHPFTKPANDTEQFRFDHQACMSEVNKKWPRALQENAAVIFYRQCLIDKGYLLLG